MLFDVVADPHEQVDLIDERPAVAAAARALLDDWTAEQLDRSLVPCDPMQTIVDEGGPFHIRGHLPAYLDRLDATGRGHWRTVIEATHGPTTTP
jgi:hypothetical protein